MRNEGLFTPPGMTESLSLPGARGGSNWGTTAADPSKGLVFLTTQDWPTIYKLSLNDPLAGRESRGNGGSAIYEQKCQTCHGVDGAGSAAGPPALKNINDRLAFDAFRRVVLAGRGEMPSFSDLDDAALNALYAYLGGSGKRASAEPMATGPVVATGGAPGGLEAGPSDGAHYSPLGGPGYPAGVDAPADRYYTLWGLYPDQPYVINPPWSSLVAYDLNRGVIKWKVPLGQDAEAAAEGAKDTGAFMAERHGIIVTSTGLLFVATSDGKIRAHDEETGKVLWTADLPAGSEGIPAMYEVAGRQFIVVPASSEINTGGGHKGPSMLPPSKISPGRRAYVAFALPQKSASR